LGTVNRKVKWLAAGVCQIQAAEDWSVLKYARKTLHISPAKGNQRPTEMTDKKDRNMPEYTQITYQMQCFGIYRKKHKKILLQMEHLQNSKSHRIP
jgi:hypothetical protein